MKCDVLVVGASAAGLMAAISASKAGSSVILLDEDLGGLNHAASTLFEGMAKRFDLKIEDCYIQKEIEGMRILSPSGSCMMIPAKGYFLDRQKFDDFYFRLAESSDVTLLQGQARRLGFNGNRRTLAFENGEIDARIVIDASGVRSGLASKMGLSTMRHPDDIAWALEATVEHPFLGEEMFFQYWLGSMAPGWKATFSPAGGDLATLGVFVRCHGQDVQSFFKSFLERFQAYKAAEYADIKDMKILSIKSGGDPIAVLPGEMVADSFMVTGGAAGQSGLVYSMSSGTICGNVAAKAVASDDVSRKALSKYEQIWNSEFYWEYRIARSALETLRIMNDEEIDKLVSGLSKRTVISGGSLFEKMIYASAKVASVRPKAVLDLAWNLVRS